jgi:hypothetical protein
MTFFAAKEILHGQHYSQRWLAASMAWRCFLASLERNHLELLTFIQPLPSAANLALTNGPLAQRSAMIYA